MDMEEATSFRSLLEKAGVALDGDNPALGRMFPANSLVTRCHDLPGLFEPAAHGELPNLVVSGCPGCGKTQLAMVLSLVHAVREPLKMVFYVAPTRPLAQEAYDNFRRLSKHLLDPSQILLSTGDESLEDWKIHQKKIRVCCTVFEKLLSLLLQNWELRSSISFVTLDESHMFNEQERGVKLDMLLTALMQPCPSGASMRVAALTVEGEEGCRFLQERLTQTERGQNIPALHVRGGTRMKSLNHILAVPMSDGQIHELRLAELRPTDTHSLGDVDTEELRRQIASFVDSLKCESDGYPIEVEAIKTLSAKYKQLLVVSTSIRTLNNIAFFLRRQRAPLATPPEKFLKRVESLRRDGLISDGLAKDIMYLAEGGIFMHTGLMHKALRAEVEKVFRGYRDEPYILFSTTTLAYGVNMYLDAVVLTSLRKWSGPGADAYLDGVVFHNILGRAGRFCETAGDAITLLPRNVVMSEDRGWIDALAACFGPRPLVVLSPNPLDPAGACENPELVNMLLYALAMADRKSHSFGGALSVRDVVELIQPTVHARKAQLSRPALRELVTKALEHLATIECEGQHIVEMERDNEGEALFAITPAGTALIETGASLEEVGQMAASLRYVSHSAKVSPKAKELLPLLWLAILSINQAVLKDVRRLYDTRVEPRHDEAKYRSSVIGFIRDEARRHFSAEEAERLYSVFDNLLKREVLRSTCLDRLTELGQKKELAPDEIREWKSFLLSPDFETSKGFKSLPKALLPEPQAVATNIIIVKRLILGLLAWLKGDTLSDVEAKLDFSSVNKGRFMKYFPPRITEKLSWRARLLASFFAGSPLLNAVQCHYVGMLSRRLQTGLKASLIPFYGKKVTRAGVSRKLGHGGDQPVAPSYYEREREYFQNECDVFCAWLRNIGSREVFNHAMSCLITFWDDPEKAVNDALDFLEGTLPELPWRSKLGDYGKKRWLAFLWLGFAMAALVDRGLFAPEDFLGRWPGSVEDLFALFDRERVPARKFLGLALVHAPTQNLYITE